MNIIDLKERSKQPDHGMVHALLSEAADASIEAGWSAELFAQQAVRWYRREERARRDDE